MQDMYTAVSWSHLYVRTVNSNYPINASVTNTLLNTLSLGGYSLEGSAVNLWFQNKHNLKLYHVVNLS